jgi:nucleotide-binding universal stress UspA family protein
MEISPGATVVGVDGSEGGRIALRWATDEAARRHHPMAVISAYEWWWPGARMAVGGEYAEAVRQQAESIVEESVGQARGIAPTVDVRGHAVHGQPGRVLVEASAGAGLVVVGSRGRGGFASMMLGSVSHQVATHATGPVVVVRGRADAAGPILVGADGSPSADHALGTALELARHRGCGLVAVRTYAPMGLPWGPGVPGYVEDPDERDRLEHELLAESVSPWREKYPEVAVEAVVHQGHPAETLAGLTHRASLVVVGTRGHGGFSGLRLGSVGVGLLHHADCPVLVDRTPLGEPTHTA